ncbi:protein transport protein yos1-like isoform X1 [Abrus precatorius]|uniref:Protein transport protein yos1-like isoform X1 n=2 Tax=Abrus precatorius TaxID=3816 RepID=A0A8B8JV99_ABRPR|nr:protein transport protein yos1-like isoform X1 [Abrus precatorius]
MRQNSILYHCRLRIMRSTFLMTGICFAVILTLWMSQNHYYNENFPHMGPVVLFSVVLIVLHDSMGFWTLLEGFLLFANALAILNEDRFLAPRGWTLAEMTGPRRSSLKGQVIGLIYACQFLRLPLILFNIVIIIVKLFSG